MKKKIAAFFMAASVASCMSGCSTASTVNHNLSKDANEFNVYRRITVTNARTDTIMLQAEGYMALSNNSSNELVVTIKTGQDQYYKRYLKERDAKDSEPLFVTGDKPHGRMSVAGIQYMLRQLGKRAGVEKTHPHRFRRTIATDLLARGMPIEQVKEFLGHEKLDTTLIYCTVKEEQVKASHRKYA
jgi:site-specific recombinase XerD